MNIGSNHRDTQSNTRKTLSPPTQRSQWTGALCVFCAAAGFSFKSILIELAYVHPVDAATLHPMHLRQGAGYGEASDPFTADSLREPNIKTCWRLATLIALPHVAVGGF